MKSETIYFDTSAKKLTPHEVGVARDFLEDLGDPHVETYYDYEVEEAIGSLMDIETFRTEDIWQMFF